jgi:glycoside hydrolase-like protein
MRAPVRATAGVLLALAVTAIGTSASAAPATSPTKVITYDGAKITVPTSWPVYDLSTHPTQCVRFDQHAVYLGHPGANQNCPANLIGRTTALLIEPNDSRAQIDDSAATQAITSNGRVLITASYGSAGPAAAAALLSPTATRAAAPQEKAAVAGAAVPGATSKTILANGYGFDTCAAPSTSTMQAWTTATTYKTVGIYIGGVNRACPDGNLSATWIKTVRSYGYTFMPTYVGRQAPCSTVGAKMSSNLTLASQNGHDAAVDAIHQMQRLGLGSGTPVYLDLEQYNATAACSHAVLRFIDAWVARLHPSGYLGAVYMSNTNLVDLVTGHKTSGFHNPDAVWWVRWNGNHSVYGAPGLPDTYWTPHKRAHQYLNRNVTIAGTNMDIDSDYIDGPVA